MIEKVGGPTHRSRAGVTDLAGDHGVTEFVGVNDLGESFVVDGLTRAEDQNIVTARRPQLGQGAAITEDSAKIADQLRPDLVCVVAHEGEQLSLVVSRGTEAPALDLSAALKAALGPLGGKGGGQGALAQGAAPDGKRAQEALDLSVKALEA